MGCRMGQGVPGRAVGRAAAGCANALPPLDAFAGQWRVLRRIDDAALGRARFEGVAEFAAHDGGLAYVERGRLTLPTGQVLAAERRYLWRPAGDGIEVFFADGRFFHRIAPAAGLAAEHLCGADLYRVRYRFAAWPVWRAVWQVAGPRKDYRMISVYRPRTAGG